MDKQQAVFEQLPVSNFKIWSSTVLKNFNNHSLVMTNNTDRIRISIQLAALVNLILFLKSLKK